jgi:hypothetical protein
MSLHLVDGEKGGVGKSFFTEILVSYCHQFGISFNLVDADQSNPDISRNYPDLAIPLDLKRDETQLYQVADQMFQLSLEKVTIVNLPSNIASSINLWIAKSNILELAQENEVNLYKWFVTTGQNQSINALKRSLKLYGTELPHILVKNFMTLSEENWNYLEEDPEYKELVNNYIKHVINLECFAIGDFNHLNIKGLNLETSQTEKNSEIVMKSRIKKYLQGHYSQISCLEIFH